MADEQAGELLRAADFEVRLGDGHVRIHEGHPCYCPQKRLHLPHRFEYRYIARDGGVVLGNYRCNGFPVDFATRGLADA